ncbi:UPF0755 protein [Chitinophaga skermanii]|uniref:Endolytic murein transglycosylase n=1 Tax=Chitinophaga skermanii TaxID=331697 RepID=A0A327QNM9_9BACT|nr:endolytic transglycosylase MltG [Chitinophaga skermanii]RAJ05262.1 UPF0755 protein [Chitinophaga skermanii]
MSKKQSKTKQNSTVKRIIVAVCCLLAGVAVYLAYQVFGPTARPYGDQKYFYIHTGSTYNDVLKGLQADGFVKHPKVFDLVANQLDYPSHVKAGRYEIKKGMSNFEIARMLRNGRQSPVRLVINKLRTKNDFIKLVDKNLEADSVSLRALLNDNVYLRQFGLDTQTVMCGIMPNTYEFFWNTSASKAFEKIEAEYKEFWTPERIAKATAQGLTPNKVIILASIVEEETNKNDEKSTIASVYLNRLRKNWRLGADPTVKFAIGDFTLRRIYNVHTQYESPYNTYRVFGLPPGPICTPSIASIEAVLNPVVSDYMFFCARADFSGYHAFAVTPAEHEANAKAYRDALSARNIK